MTGTIPPAVRDAFDASPIGVALWSIRGGLLHANPVFADLVGRRSDDLPGEPLSSFVHPADGSALASALEGLVVGTRNHATIDIRCRDGAGAPVWLGAHLHAVYGERRRPAYLVSQIFDFSRGRRTTAAASGPPAQAPPAGVAAAELDAIPAIVWTAGGDAAGASFVAGAAAAEYLATGSPDVIDAILEGIHPDDRDDVEERWHERSSILAPFAATARSRRRDGEWRWLAHRARPCFGADGRFEGYAGVSVDVTDEHLVQDRVEQELERFRVIAQGCPVPLARTDAAGRLIYASPRWESFLDDPATRLAGHGWLDLLAPEHGEQLARLSRRSLRTREPFGIRVRVRDTLVLDESTDVSGGKAWGDLRAAPVFRENGKLDGFVVVVADITRQVLDAQHAERLASVLEAGTDYVVIEEAGALTYVNESAANSLDIGLPAEPGDAGAGAPGETGPFLMDVLTPDSYDYFHRVVRAELARSGSWTGELTVRHVSGREVPVSVLALAHDDAASGDGVTVVARDISELKSAHAQVSALATHDYLTGLPNRVKLYEHVDRALSRFKRSSQTVALLFLDLDKFKPINDQLGHHAGDRVLVTLADRMHEVVRETDTLARIGGDEFAVLVEGYESRGQLERVASRLIAAVSQPIEVEGTSVRVGVSIGIVAPDDPAIEPDALLSRADAAMYLAKSAGRGCFVFAPAAQDGAAAAGQ